MSDKHEDESHGWVHYKLLRGDTIKFIFDYIRNIGIAASLIGGGNYIRKHPEFLKTHMLLNDGLGWSLALIGIILFFLNYAQAAWKIDSLKPHRMIGMSLSLLINVLSVMVMLLLATKNQVP